MVEVNRASFIGYVGGEAVPFPTSSFPLPSSWPCRHPFHRLDDGGNLPRLRRSEDFLSISRQDRNFSPPLATANVSGNHRFHFTSSILPSASSAHPRFPLYAATSIPSIPFERGKKLDLRMNIPSAGEFITFIYPRVN